MSYLSVLMHDLRFAVALAAVYTHNSWVARTGQSAGNEPGRLADPSQRERMTVDVTTQTVQFWSPVLWRQVRYEIPQPLPAINEPIVPPGYVLYPTESDAEAFAREAEADASRMIAYDIETPRSPGAKEDETDELEDQAILSVQFSVASETGIFMPWRDPFIEVARRVLALRNPKIGANCWRFDDPRLAAHGAPVCGRRYDLRWAWKHFQPDLSAGLQFVSSFYTPGIGPWKHLDRSHPQVYGIRDVDVLMRCI